MGTEMNFTQDWQKKKYTETFESELRGLERRRAADPNCTIADIEGTLRNLYIMDGADHDGRGGVQDAVMAATIAAYERFISCWQAEV